jgi:hypothetical protein
VTGRRTLLRAALAMPGAVLLGGAAGCAETIAAARPAESPVDKALADLAAAGTVQGTFIDHKDNQTGRHPTKGTFSVAANGDLRVAFTRQRSQYNKPNLLLDYEVVRIGDAVYARSATFTLPAGKTWAKVPLPNRPTPSPISTAIWLVDPTLVLKGATGAEWTPNTLRGSGMAPVPTGSKGYEGNWAEYLHGAPDARLGAWLGQTFKANSITAYLILDGSGRLFELNMWGDDGADTRSTFSLTANYKGFGEPVDIKAPPADQVTDQPVR